MRLIDADRLKKEMWEDYERNDMFYPDSHHEAFRVISNIIDNMPTVSGWISVKDKMPPNDPSVKVLTYGNPVVTHWMPLPEPPKEG